MAQEPELLRDDVDGVHGGHRTRRAPSWLSATGLRLSEWFQRWFPDAFALGLAAVAIVSLASLATGHSAVQTARWFGSGFWDLVAFTMQMSMIIVSGYTLATAPPVHSLIERMARIPRTGRSAAAFVGLFSMLSSLLSWSFSLIFSALLARAVMVHGVGRVDVRAGLHQRVSCGRLALPTRRQFLRFFLSFVMIGTP